MDPVQPVCPGQVEPAADDDSEAGPTQRLQAAHELPQLCIGQGPFPKNHQAAPAPGRQANDLGERPARRPSLPIRDVAETRDHRTSMRPSSGLEACAYRRRGMRPAS